MTKVLTQLVHFLQLDQMNPQDLNGLKHLQNTERQKPHVIYYVNLQFYCSLWCDIILDTFKASHAYTQLLPLVKISWNTTHTKRLFLRQTLFTSSSVSASSGWGDCRFLSRIDCFLERCSRNVWIMLLIVSASAHSVVSVACSHLMYNVSINGNNGCL